MEQGLRAIYDSFGIKDGIEGHIFRETLRLLNEAAAEGVRAESPQMTSYQELLLQEFRSSNEVFSAFRTHRMQNDVARQLLGKDGKRKSFEQWKRDVKGMTDHYFGPWLRTEYNTAVIRAQNAARWKRFEQDAGIMPNLTWMPTTSATPDLAHERYWAMKLTLPVNHPFWERERPGNRWNCKCSLEQTDDVPVTTDAEFDALPKKTTAQKGLDNNPATDGKLFSDTHPYYTQAFPGAKGAADKLLSEQMSDFIVNGYKQIKVLDGCNAPLNEKVVGIENNIRKNKRFETAVVFNDKGDIVIDKRGKATSVGFTPKEVEIMKDKIITHNHPIGWGYKEKDWRRIGNSFSKADLSLAITADVAEIRAVTPNYTFSLKRPPQGWGIDMHDFNKLYTETYNRIYTENNKLVYNGIITPVQAETVHYHSLNKEIAKKLGWIYEKRRTI